MLVGFGIVFELPLFIVMLNVAGILTHERFRKWRRMMIFAIFLIAGIVNPSPDPWTMLLLGGIAVLLTELAEVFVYFNDKRRARLHPSPYEGLADDELSPIEDPEPVDADSQLSPGGTTPEPRRMCARWQKPPSYRAHIRPFPGGTSPVPPDVRATGPDRKNRDRIRPARTDKSHGGSPLHRLAAPHSYQMGVKSPTLGGMSTPAVSPAERYAKFRERQAAPEFSSFRELYDFGFDPFQVAACAALTNGDGVLVAAPTGSGKTVVGEYAVHLALQQNRKCFYTTPIKALSNQKYNDLVRRYDTDTVGLLTGDNAINGDAPVIVMTTEVLRNMLYAGSPALKDLGYVVLDEVHYLADRSRGAVWEEVIIHLPESVRVVALSATVSNAEEFGDWLAQVRGGTEVIVDEHRPVPLWQHMLAGRRLYDLFTDDDHRQVNPDLVRLAHREAIRQPASRPGRGGHRPKRNAAPYRPEIIDRLDAAGLLPAITFIFSRAGCDAAVQQCLAAGLRLTTPDEARIIEDTAARRTADIPDEDLTILGYHDWVLALKRGIAAHHAGMLPAFKEAVEELFTAGLVKAVFATETLALGINMPAQDRRARKARQVERRSPRRAHPGRVHPAHRPRRTARHRRRGPRRRAVAARHGPRRGGRPRGYPHVPAQLVLPPVLQHGGQPDLQRRPEEGRRPPRVELRPVPGRPRRRRPGQEAPPP